MKTFNDLKEGDYIYELDTFIGNVDCVKIRKIYHSVSNGSVIIHFDKKTSIYFNKDESFSSIFGVTYFCNKEDCLDKLFKLTKYYQTALKTAKQNIQRLKEI